ncbi:hypothetical protein H5T88_01865 [bacterium]|nr:hypothetical protein [bacterium]
MRKFKFFLVVFFVLLSLICYLFFRPKPLSDREAIMQVFQKGVVGIRTKDASLLLSLISPNYHDDFGITFWDIKRNIKRELNRAIILDLTIEDIQLAITPPDALGRLKCTLLIQMEDMFQPLVLPLSVDVYLKKERKRWKIIRVEGYSSVVGQIYGEEF